MSDIAQIWEIKDGRIVEKHDGFAIMDEVIDNLINACEELAIGTNAIERMAEKLVSKRTGNLAVFMAKTRKGWVRA